MSKEEVRKKRISGEAHDINKQSIYIALKSKIEPKAHYASEPTWGDRFYLLHKYNRSKCGKESQLKQRVSVEGVVSYKLAVTVHRCLNGRAPPYLSEHCIPVSSADTRRHLRSANRHVLAVPRFRLNNYGRWAFLVAGPMAWNSLPFYASTQNVLVCTIPMHPAY